MLAPACTPARPGYGSQEPGDTAANTAESAAGAANTAVPAAAAATTDWQLPQQ